MIKNTESYKRILNKRKILKLVINIECYRSYYESIPLKMKRQFQEYILNNSNIPTQIFQIVTEYKNGLVDLNNILYEPCTKEFEDLKNKFPNDSKVLALEDEINKLCKLCGYKKSLPIIMVDFYLKLTTNPLEEELNMHNPFDYKITDPVGSIKQNALMKAITTLLRCLDSEKSKEEIYYLMNICTNVHFYKAFFIDSNRDNKPSLQRNFDKFLVESNNRSSRYMFQVFIAYRQEGIYPSLDAISTLLTPSFVKINNIEDTANMLINPLTEQKFDMMNSSQIRLSEDKVDIQEFVKKVLKRYKDEQSCSLDYYSYIQLIELMSKIITGTDYLKAFAKFILGEQDNDDIAVNIASYLEVCNYIPNTYADSFIFFYNQAKQELAENNSLNTNAQGKEKIMVKAPVSSCSHK